MVTFPRCDWIQIISIIFSTFHAAKIPYVGRMFPNLPFCFPVLPPTPLPWHCIQQKEGKEKKKEKTPIPAFQFVTCAVKGTEDLPHAFQNISLPMHLSSNLSHWLLKN